MKVPNDANAETDVDEATDESVKLMDFPNEILLRMFQNFTDTHLLDMTRVCSRFEALAGETFAKRYNGGTEDKYFKVFCTSDDDDAIYLPIFEAFGKKMIALEIIIKWTAQFSHDYWLCNFIRDYCTRSSITHVIVKDPKMFIYQQFFDSLPAITHLTFVNPLTSQWADRRFEHVINFVLRYTDYSIQGVIIQRFVQNNPQLQNLVLDMDFHFDPLDVLSGKLNRLEVLALKYYSLPVNLTKVTFQQLKSLTISLDHDLAANVLQAIERGCKRIKYLEIKISEKLFGTNVDEAEDEGTQEAQQEAERIRHFSELAPTFGLFNQLKTLKLSVFDYNSIVLDILAEQLPKSLTVLCLEFHKKRQCGVDYNSILCILTKLTSLKHISISFRGQINNKSELFGLDWCREFSSIAAKREHAVRCEFNDTETHIITTNGKCIVNGELRCWTGCEPDLSQSETHILDLNEKCIDKILEWLPDDDVFKVYQTCTALKKVAGKRIQSIMFHFDDHDISVFEDTFADDIRKLVIKFTDDSHSFDMDMLTHVRDRCSKNLIEFEINRGKTSLMDDLNLSFPNLEKLTIGQIEASAAGKILPTIYCPKLKYLEIGNVYAVPAIYDSRLEISIENLTVLKLQLFDDVIANLFSTLSDEICLQLTKFTVTRIEDTKRNGNRLINMISRFRNLVELNIKFSVIESTHTVYLFERCTKLVTLTLDFGNYSRFNDTIQQFLQICKKHCNDLKVIQLMRYDCVSEFGEEIRQFISNEFPNVQLYDIKVRRANYGKPKYEVTLLNKSFICETPY